jgi:hypothetical protein
MGKFDGRKRNEKGCEGVKIDDGKGDILGLPNSLQRARGRHGCWTLSLLSKKGRKEAGMYASGKKD